MDQAAAMLEALEGEWLGAGNVRIPGSEPIDFADEIRFWRRTETSLNYYQRAMRTDGQLSHSEVGVWRLGSPYEVDLESVDFAMSFHLRATMERRAA